MSERMIRCKADEHYYDSATYSKCPYCAQDLDVETIAISKDRKEKNLGDEEKTQVYWKNKNNINEAPILGWLVVMEGMGLGKDFRISATLSSLGRDEDNDICINNGDKMISRKRHCLIEYDARNNLFYVERGENNTYLNGKRVSGEGKELKSGDILEIGETKIKFVPFCTKEFSWN